MRLMFQKIEGYVYFVQMGMKGPIKIGYAKKPQRRLSELQSSNPEQLYLLYFFPGTMEDEQNLQRICQKDSVRGEWFWPSDKVMREIEEQKRIDGKRNWTPDLADPSTDFRDERWGVGV